ncbi:MAG: nicotinate-nucleotide adenylyltransferase [Gammaproteobacteria bacterium]|nr:nicotinate-nucleotide adenylyltransferase [Gammaproteobacteria bacterium]
MIGILGGAFDPVHFGHLRPALELEQALGLEQLRLIPTGRPPHREAAHAEAGHRVTMLERAIEGSDWLIDRREIERDGPSYMVDTLAELRTELGAERPLALMLGLDAFMGLTGWHQWRRLFELAHIVVSHRPGAELQGMDAELARELSQRQALQPSELHGRSAGLVWLHPVTQLDISSTAIRSLLAEGNDPRFLMPDAVVDYLRSHKLYQR